MIEENAPGISFARKSGVREAKGEIIVFCDDDNWLERGYIKTAFEIMQNDLTIGVLVGQSRAVSNNDIPTWFYTYYGNYACGVLATHSGDVSSRLWVWGAGMVVRKSQMEKLYSRFKHTTRDRTKDSMESGGDVEICYWHILDNKKLWYDERLKLEHFMSSDRLNIDSAINYFGDLYENPTFYIFSDDIEWARLHLKIPYNTIYVDINDDKSDYEDLRLMSLCKHNILANSTFIWWGAYLNKNPNKSVIAPKMWFKDEILNQQTTDLLPKSWIQI